MNGSGKIRVIKNDQVQEPFDVQKLAGSMFRAMQGTRGRLYDATQLSIAIGIYLRRSDWMEVTSDALSELAIKVLGRCGLADAARTMVDYRQFRLIRRTRLAVLHEGGKLTMWDKGWLSSWAQQSWMLSRKTSRILAGQVERQLLAGDAEIVSRLDVLDMLNRLVAEYGLADAVPVRQPATT